MGNRRIVFCFHTHDHEINFGIGFMSSALKQAGVEAELIVYRETERHADRPEDVIERILEKNPDIVAFSIMTFNWHKIKKIIIPLRSRFDGLIIAGGYHVVLSPEDVLSFPGVDAVCIGEGEKPLLDLVSRNSLRRGESFPDIKGLLFKGQDVSAEALKRRWLVHDLEDYPYLDYDIFSADEDLRKKHLGVLSPAGIFALPLITGRGCPYRCTYCSNSALLDFYGGAGKFIRRYSPGKAVANIRELTHTFQPQFYEFLDETFTLNKAWVKEFCLLYREQVSTPFIVMSRIDTIDEPTVAFLADSGMKVFLFGIESGDETYRVKYLKRKMSNRTIREGAKLLKRYGIIIVTFNMFGLPFETRENIARTISLNEDIEPDAALPFIYQPFPSTELGEMAFSNNLFPPPPGERWDFCSASLDTPDLPAQYVVDVVGEFRERFAIRNIEKIYARLREMTARAG